MLVFREGIYVEMFLLIKCRSPVLKRFFGDGCLYCLHVFVQANYLEVASDI